MTVESVLKVFGIVVLLGIIYSATSQRAFLCLGGGGPLYTPRTSTVGYGTWLRTIDDDLQYLNFGVRGTPHGLEVGKT